MLHLYLQLCWAGECLQPALISSQYQNRRQNTWAATAGTRVYSGGSRHSQQGGISGVPTIAVKKYTESKGRNIAFCTMQQCTLHTIHQCCGCVAVSSAAPLICYQPSAPPSNTPPSTAAQWRQPATSTGSLQFARQLISPSDHPSIQPNIMRSVSRLPDSVVAQVSGEASVSVGGC